jgi:hypothetical protein
VEKQQKLWTCDVTGVVKPEGSGWFHVRANRQFCVERYTRQPKFRRWKRVFGAKAVEKLMHQWISKKRS